MTLPPPVDVDFLGFEPGVEPTIRVTWRLCDLPKEFLAAVYAADRIKIEDKTK